MELKLTLFYSIFKNLHFQKEKIDFAIQSKFEDWTGKSATKIRSSFHWKDIAHLHTTQEFVELLKKWILIIFSAFEI
jgi:hypothetical protein